MSSERLMYVQFTSCAYGVINRKDLINIIKRKTLVESFVRKTTSRTALNVTEKGPHGDSPVNFMEN